VLERVMAWAAPYRGLTRYVPAPGWWVVKRWLMARSPVKTLEQLVQSGVDLLMVMGSGESRRVYRGEQRRLHALVAAGGVHVETVPHLEHSLLDRASRDRVSELFVAYVADRAADLQARPRPSAAG
jgi:hypothetical protein